VNEVRLRQQGCDLRHEKDVSRCLLTAARLALALRVQRVKRAKTFLDGERLDRLEALPERFTIEPEIGPVGHRDPIGGYDLHEALAHRVRVAIQRCDEANKCGLWWYRKQGVAVEHHRYE